MTLCLVRGSILGRIRAQTLTLNGRLRSLSSAADDQINSSNPTEVSDHEMKTSLTEDEINSYASCVTTRIDEIIKFGDPPLPFVYGAEVILDDALEDLSEESGFQVLSRVADNIQNFPEVDKFQIFHAKVFYRSMSYPYSHLSKDGIITGVLNVIQSYPKVGDYKVTEETHFYKDLGFDKWDFIDVIQALQVEFRLYIPDEIVSCKLAIEYIYDHRMERLYPEEFRKRLFLTGEFGESKSEFRRMFVREGEIGTKYALSDARHNNLYSGFTNWNGFKMFQFFKDLEGRWVFG